MKYIKLIASIIIIVVLIIYGLNQKNPLIKTSEYYSKDKSLTIYKQWSKENKYFIKSKNQWYCFDTELKMVFLPNWPENILGKYFYDFDMNNGVSITFEIKVDDGYLNWQKNFFEFSHGKSKRYKIYKKL